MVSDKDFLSVLDHDNVALVERALDLCSDHETYDIQLLATSKNTEISGGRKDPSEISHLVFDEKTKYLRKD